MSDPKTLTELHALLPESAIEVVGEREELVIYTGWSVAADDETLEPMHEVIDVIYPRLHMRAVPDRRGESA